MKKISAALALLCLSLAGYAQSYVQMFVTTPACNNDGVVTAVATNLTPPLTFTWSAYTTSGYITIVHAGVNSLSDQFTNWSGYNTSVEVTDAIGTYVSMVNFAELPFTLTTLSNSPALCPALGTATAIASDGAAPYDYSWMDLAGNPLGSGSSISLPGGQFYTLLVTDANGCTIATPADSITSSASFYPTIATTAASCTNGTATVTLSGSGTPPYTYQWSNGATSTSISNLMKGTYGVTVTDAIGCSATDYGNVQQTPTINLSYANTPATCVQNDGASMAIASGGAPPYTYVWSSGATGQNLAGVASGLYTVSVTDANGCIGAGNTYITTSTPITATYSTTPSQCTTANGSATLNIVGGTAPYAVVWNTYPAQTGTTATGLSAGSYGFTITDAVGCVRTGSAVVQQIINMSVNANAGNAVCPATTGSASVVAIGGTGYTYQWSNGATTPTISAVPLGSYSVTVTDVATGCARTKNVNILQISPVNVGISTTPATCIFNADGLATANATGGTAPYNYSWSSGMTGSSITSLPAGQVYVNATDANGCTNWTFGTVGYDASNNSCYCTLTGQVYDDLNANCTMDLGEQGIQNIQMHAAGGGGFDYTNSAGQYAFIVPTGSYTLSQTVESFYPLAPCQNNAIAVSATASTGCVITNNFANTINPIHDLHIITTSLGTPPIPGFDYYQQVVISNQGTVDENDIIAGHLSDGQLGAGSFSPSLVFVNSAANYHAISAGDLTLTPAAGHSSIVTYTVPTNTPLGTSLLFKDSAAHTGPMSNWLSDYTPWNNVDYYTPIVVGSFDPNYKEVSPRGTGDEGTIMASDSVLEYTVHFQNLGSYPAQNIFVLDTLDADLDWTSLRPIYLSHNGSITISEQGVMKANFPNIMLPAKDNQPILSNGMFTYTIKMKDGLAMGTQVKNSASIYFDFNAPVLTNTTLNTLGAPTSAATAQASDVPTMRLFPNPAADHFTAEVFSTFGGMGTLSISNTQGQTVASAPATVRAGKNALPVDVKKLPAGVYFVTFSDGRTVQSGKLVIVK